MYNLPFYKYKQEKYFPNRNKKAWNIRLLMYIFFCYRNRDRRYLCYASGLEKDEYY